MSFDNNLEGYNAVQTMWFRYWNPQEQTFTTREPCRGARGTQFDCWSLAVAIHAVGDSAKAYRDMTFPIVESAVRSVSKYYNPKIGGYSVYNHGHVNSGDEDICYDDCAHLLRGFLACYEGTGNPEYLGLAKNLMKFLLGGIVTHEKYGYKGLKWHYSKKYMSSISNCVAATCALKLIPYAKNEAEKEQLYNFAVICLDFIWNHMLGDDGLVMDGIGKDSDVIDKRKFTYNTGNTLTAFCLMYKVDGNEAWMNKAKTLAEAATHRGKTMFDRDYPDYGKRYWHDPSFFVQLLVEGLADYLETFGDRIPESTRNACKTEIHRHLSYFRKYCYDPRDQMYYCSFDIYRITPELHKRYQTEFAGHKDFQPCDEDRMQGGGSAGERQPCKSLIGEASAARIFLQGARVIPKMEPTPC